MNNTIKQVSEIAKQVELCLYKLVIDKENHMNECDCDSLNCDGIKYDFSNTLPHNAVEARVFCLNCGGMITPNEMEM
jgi:hypothetical protein